MLPAPDLPRNLSRLRAVESEYQRHLQEFRRALPSSLQRSSGIGCGTNGAGYYDTSLYFAGDVAVGSFYVTGTGGPWTAATAASEFANLVLALDHFIDLQPNARLTFVYNNEVDGGGLPLAAPPNERDYVNDLRQTWCTDWAFMVTLINGGVWPNAYLCGPSLRMDTTFVPFSDVLRHEVGHMFCAGDAYAPFGPLARYGYMMAAHANACGTGGGFFSGAGECLDDLMAGWGPNFGYNSIIGPWTAAQFGWLASGGDGALDLTKTKPAINATSVVHVVNTATSAVTYNGVAFDRPPLTELSFPYGDVSINRIAGVKYRVNNAAWQDATPADGVFDSGSEAFNFATPPLPNGTYAVEIQALNTVGAVASMPYAEQLVIMGSSVTNTRPFGFLTATPERAKLGTLISASGAASRDLEPGALSYSWKWDSSGWTPFSSTPTATHVYTTPGTYALQLRVRDVGGAINLVSRNVIAESYDVPPVVAFVAKPEARHFTTGPGYSISLSVAGTRDPETPYAQLMVQWDVDCDGWDGPPALQKTRAVWLVNTHFQRSDRRCFRVQVTDAANNATQAERFIWVVPYDHRPALVGLTFTPAGANYTLTVNAADADSATMWDGILEYRFDFDGDGVWDTTFDPTPTIPLSAAYRSSVSVQVRDRFDARLIWLWCSPNAC